MKSIGALVILGIAIALGTTGCTKAFPVPPAHMGKILSAGGYQVDYLTPGQNRQSYSRYKRQLVLVSTAVYTTRESMTMVLKDKLKLGFDVRARISLRDDEQSLDTAFRKITPEGNANGDVLMISSQRLYDVYGAPAVRERSREIMSQYTVEEVQENYKRISGEVFVAIQESLEGTPLILQDAALGDIAYPKVVTDAIELVKKRELAIQEAEADAQVDLIKAAKSMEVATANRQVVLTRAATERDANRIIGEGITPEFLALKQLEAQTAMAANNAAVFIPFEAVNAVGPQIRMFNGSK